MLAYADVTTRRSRPQTEAERAAEKVAAAAARRMGHVMGGRRDELGISQTVLAERLGVAQNRVSAMERGEVYWSGNGPSSRPLGWQLELTRRIEEELQLAPGTLFRAGGYVPEFDLEGAVKSDPTLAESAKPVILAAIRSARTPG